MISKRSRFNHLLAFIPPAALQPNEARQGRGIAESRLGTLLLGADYLASSLLDQLGVLSTDK